MPDRVGSVRLPAAPPLRPPLEPRWVWRSGQRAGTWLGFTPARVLVGTCDESTHLIHALDPDTGQVIWRLDGLEAIGLCGDVLLAHQPRPSTHFVQAFQVADGHPLWQHRLARALDTDYCAARAGFYAWPRSTASECSRLTADFHPLNEPDLPRELEGPPGYYLEHGREHEGCLAFYRWGDGPGQHVVYRDFRPVWSADRRGSWQPSLFPDSQGWVLCGLETTEAWSLEGQLLWTGPGFTRCWVGEQGLLGQRQAAHLGLAGPDGSFLLDRSTGAAQPLALGRVRDLALAGNQVWFLNWEEVGTEEWSYPLAGLGGIWARLFASRLVVYAGRLYLGGVDGSLASLC